MKNDRRIPAASQTIQRGTKSAPQLRMRLVAGVAISLIPCRGRLMDLGRGIGNLGVFGAGGMAKI